MKFANVVCICLALAGGSYAPKPSVWQKLTGGSKNLDPEGTRRTPYRPTRRSPLELLIGRKKEPEYYADNTYDAQPSAWQKLVGGKKEQGIQSHQSGQYYYGKKKRH